MYGRPTLNKRQWSAVSTEEVEALCVHIGVEAFPAGALGENLRLSGVKLADVPSGSVIEFPSGARLAVGGQNDPCANAARELAQSYGALVGQYFVKQALGRRGVIGVVLAPGAVRPSDKVTITFPDAGEAQAEERDRHRASPIPPIPMPISYVLSRSK